MIALKACQAYSPERAIVLCQCWVKSMLGSARLGRGRVGLVVPPVRPMGNATENDESVVRGPNQPALAVFSN